MVYVKLFLTFFCISDLYHERIIRRISAFCGEDGKIVDVFVCVAAFKYSKIHSQSRLLHEKKMETADL